MLKCSHYAEEKGDVHDVTFHATAVYNSDAQNLLK